MRISALMLVIGSWMICGVNGASADSEITVAAGGTVSVVPDRAMVSLTQCSYAETIQQAVEDNERSYAILIDTLNELGIPVDSIEQSSYRSGLSRKQDRRSKWARPRDEYFAQRTVRVFTSDFDLLFRICAAAVKVGAGPSGYRFTAMDTKQARERALDLATKKAWSSARTIAAASGRELGELVELQYHSGSVREKPTVVDLSGERSLRQPYEFEITEYVTGRWRLEEKLRSD